jgi:hypothetical protein
MKLRKNQKVGHGTPAVRKSDEEETRNRSVAVSTCPASAEILSAAREK